MYWAFLYLMMLAMGLATEAMITVMTTRFIAYFLLALVNYLMHSLFVD
jgi:hypothetical protein